MHELLFALAFSLLMARHASASTSVVTLERYNSLLTGA